jgi:hypothetical protein
MERFLTLAWEPLFVADATFRFPESEALLFLYSCHGPLFSFPELGCWPPMALCSIETVIGSGTYIGLGPLPFLSVPDSEFSFRYVLLSSFWCLRLNHVDNRYCTHQTSTNFTQDLNKAASLPMSPNPSSTCATDGSVQRYLLIPLASILTVPPLPTISLC